MNSKIIGMTKNPSASPVVQIGNATLYRGDCLAIMPKLGPVDYVVTDPPYEDELHKGFGRIRRTDGGKTLSDIDFAGVNSNRSDIAKAITEISDRWALIFTLAEGVWAWRDDLQSAGAKWDTTLAWIKPNSMPRFNGQGAARGFENIVTCWCGSGYRNWNAGGKRGIYTHCTNKNRDGRHPTEKPIALMIELLTDYTNTDQIILDPFMGSGTTGVACARLGRKFTGIEINETYFNIACERIQKAYDQPDLFVEPPRKVEQLSL